MGTQRFTYRRLEELVLEEVRRESCSGLDCPECGRVVPMGRRDVVRHPMAEWLRERSFRITGWWALLLGHVVLLTMLSRTDDIREWPGWWALGLTVVPQLVIYFAIKCFPQYRVWSCPYCGFRRLDRLSRKIPERAVPMKERRV